MKKYTNDSLLELADDLKDGKIAAFPTDTVYGVGCIYGDRKALHALKNIKCRPEEKPIPMMASSLEQAADLVELNDMAKCLAEAFLPGAMTLIVPVSAKMDREFTNGKETVALRVPNAPQLLEVIEACGKPLMVSSANISGQPAALTCQEAVEMLPGLDGVLDGPCRVGIASTIVDCTKDHPVILREGPISQAQIDALF